MQTDREIKIKIQENGRDTKRYLLHLLNWLPLHHQQRLSLGQTVLIFQHNSPFVKIVPPYKLPTRSSLPIVSPMISTRMASSSPALSFKPMAEGILRGRSVGWDGF
ncbi:hypothetical protein Pcinc_034377 [Petrolisthes cinctipes]|uniref:Uncharacterized protein n=1 Tax=Petrolisthes cinctipes TaxID=88211 RepID=A0AAE1EQF5_PETCI|nr:hypothetical protein Pcinc_034377 [Petrolisthes cinctipes]